MEMNVYAIFDMKLGGYMRPFFVQNDAVAMRAFGEIAMDESSEIGKHPEDYCLYRLCVFDLESGEFGDFERRSLAKASDFYSRELKEVK